MNNEQNDEQYEAFNIDNDPSTVVQPRKKTMSEAALAANRANAKKCTGPKTREGKFKSCLNALKHGLYSHTFILKTEDADIFENFSKSYIDEFQPATPSELELLKQLISAAWRRTRIAELIQLRIDHAIDTVMATPSPLPEQNTNAHLTLRAYEHLEDQNPLSHGKRPTRSASPPSSSAPSPASNPSATKNSGTKPNSPETA